MKIERVPEVLSANELKSEFASFYGIQIKNGIVKIPQGVKKIGNRCFYQRQDIIEISLPKTLIGIGVSAFQGCKKLKKVVCPAPIVNIKEYAFSDCNQLQVLDINMQIQDDNIRNILKNNSGEICENHLRFYKLTRFKNDYVACATYELTRPVQPILPNITNLDNKNFLIKGNQSLFTKDEYVNKFKEKED